MTLAEASPQTWSPQAPVGSIATSVTANIDLATTSAVTGAGCALGSRDACIAATGDANTVTVVNQAVIEQPTRTSQPKKKGVKASRLGYDHGRHNACLVKEDKLKLVKGTLKQKIRAEVLSFLLPTSKRKSSVNVVEASSAANSPTRLWSR